jgi:hypothetical protein
MEISLAFPLAFAARVRQRGLRTCEHIVIVAARADGSRSFGTPPNISESRRIP